MLKLLKRLFQALLILTLLLLGVVTAIVILFDPNDYKAEIEQEASRILRRDVQINGDISLTKSLSPGVTLRDVTVSDAPWTGNDRFAQVTEMDVAVALMPLIDRQIVVDRLTLRDAAFTLTATPGRGNNLPLPGAPERAPADADAAVSVVVAITEMVARAPADADMQVRVEGMLEDVPVRFEGSARALNEILSDPLGPLPLQGSLELANLSGEISGHVQAPQGGQAPQADLAFDLTAPDFSILNSVLVSKVRTLTGQEEGFMEAQGRQLLQGFIGQGRLVGRLVVDETATGAVSLSEGGLDAFGLRLGVTGTLGLRPDPLAPGGRIGPGALDAQISLKTDDLSVLNQLLQSPMVALALSATGTDLPIRALPPASIDISANLSKQDGAPFHPNALRLPNLRAAIALAGAEVVATGDVAGGQSTAFTISATIPDPGALAQSLKDAGLLAGAVPPLPATPVRFQGVLTRQPGTVGAEDGRDPADRFDLADARLSVQSGPATVDLTGGIADLTGTLALTLDLAGTIPAWPATLAPLAAVGLAPATLPLDPGPTRFSGRLSGGMDALSLSELTLTAEPEGGSATIQGRIDQLESAPIADLAFAVEVPRLDALGATLPPLAPARLSGRMSGSAEALTVTDLVSVLGPVEAQGVASLRAEAGGRPKLSAEVAFNALDLGAIGVALGQGQQSAGTASTAGSGGSAAADNGSGRVIPATPLPREELAALDAQITLTSPAITSGALRVADVRAQIILEDSRLALEPLSGTVNGTPLTASAIINARTDPASARLTLNGQGVSWGRLLRDLGVFDYAEGTVDLDIDLLGTGNSVAAVAGSADGHLSLIAGPGEVDTDSLDGLTGGVLRALLPGDQAARTVVHCLALDLPVRAGVAQARTLLLDTSIWTLTGEGTVNLATEALDLRVEHTPTGDTLKLPLAVTVGGTLADPRPSPRLNLDLSQSLLSNRSDDALPAPLAATANGRACQESLARRATAAASLGIPGFGVLPTEVQDAVQQGGEAVDQVEERLREAEDAVRSGDPALIEETIRRGLEDGDQIRGLIEGFR